LPLYAYYHNIDTVKINEVKVRLAKIHDVNFSVSVKSCFTEEDLACAVLGMDLQREGSLWFAQPEFVIAARSVKNLRNNKALEIIEPSIRSYVYGNSEETRLVETENHDLPPIIVPNGFFLIAKSLTFRSYNEGILVDLYGSELVYEEETSDGTTLIWEGATSSITRDNLPVKISTIAQDKLINIQPVVFKPEGIY
jgi:hypothetical protein